jgi:hypothetical protein
MGVKKALGVMVGAALLIFGGLWAAQGLGYLGGDASQASNTSVPALLGPILAGLGVALIYVSLRGSPSRR